MVKTGGIVIAVIIAVGILIGGYFWLSHEKPQKYTEPVEKVTIAVGAMTDSAPVYIALEKEYFKNEGLDVAVQIHSSGKSALNAVKEGKADMATVAETPIVHSVLKGEKITIIATIEKTEKSNGIVARKDRGISTFGDLEGKKIGVTLGTNGEFFLDVFITASGISRKDLEYINLKPDEMFDALVNGEVDAVSSWNPYILNLRKELGDNGLTSYGGGIYTLFWNLVGTQDFVNKNPEIARKVLRGLSKADEFIKENPDESQKITSDSMDLDSALVSELWDIHEFEVTLDQTLVLALEDEARWAIRNKHTDETEVPDYLNYIYIGALDEVKPEAVGIID